MVSIVLADNHTVVRLGVKALLQSESDFSVIGEANNGLEAIRLTEKLHPDVVVLDLMMEGMSGLEVTRRITKKLLQTRVVILTTHNGEAYVLEVMRAGARGYVLKDSASTELVRAIREVSSGRQYLCPPLSSRAIESYAQQTTPVVSHPLDPLTLREREVFQLTATGLTYVEIAARLYISRRTVEVHRARLMMKLRLQNQTQLVHYAIRQELLPEEAQKLGLVQA